MPAADGSLYHAFAQIADFRKARGRSYDLPAVLALATVAMLCGCRSLYAIAQFGRDYNHLAPLLGFTRPHKTKPATYRTPCVAELHFVFTRLDVRLFEAALTSWILARGVGDLERRQVAIDGKALRGSHGDQLPGVHLLAAYAPDLQAVLAQLKVPTGTNEHKTALELIRLIPLEGALITGDAAFTQRDLCQAIVDGGGDYFFTVKDNQPTLAADIAAAFDPAFSPRGAPRAQGG